jgi:uncharacterized protein with HEPN domain
MPPNDRTRLLHMLEAAQEAVSFAAGRTAADLAQDRMLALALVKCIEIIGEAASKVGPNTRNRFEQIPWLDIVGMRNRLIHAYFDIDFDRVLDTITADLPPLIASLESALGEPTTRSADSIEPHGQR